MRQTFVEIVQLFVNSCLARACNNRLKITRRYSLLAKIINPIYTNGIKIHALSLDCGPQTTKPNQEVEKSLSYLHAKVFIAFILSTARERESAHIIEIEKYCSI